MTTAQRTFNGPVPPPPCSAAHIDPLLNEDYAKALTPAPEPPRCRFLSSDKRQCRMLRADHHPDFCLFHAARQEEIFALLPEREFDLAPELVALAADLTTATGVNRALGEVFRLLAKHHITRKDAVAFGYIAQLLLQTVPGVRAEAVSAFGHKVWQENLKLRLRPQGSAAKSYPPAANVYPPTKGYPQDTLLAEDKGELRGDRKVELSPLNKVLPSSLTPQPDPPVAESTAPICAPAAPAASPSAPPQFVKPDDPAPVAAADASATDTFSRPNYDDLLNRSLDLLDGKFDASPQGQREARRLLKRSRTPDADARNSRRMRTAANALATHAECALTNSFDLKFFRMRTYKKRPGGHTQQEGEATMRQGRGSKRVKGARQNPEPLTNDVSAPWDTRR